MPISVRQAFHSSGLVLSDSLPWGVAETELTAGIYVVSSARDPAAIVPDDREIGDISAPALEDLIRRKSGITIDGRPASGDALAARLREFWFDDEVILYVGQTSRKIGRRLQEYLATPLGNPGPHRGGCWIHALVRAHGLWVHTASADDPRTSEALVLRAFEESVSLEQRRRLQALGRAGCIAPWANLRGWRHTLKPHGVLNACS